jgi:hypothetical protein
MLPEVFNRTRGREEVKRLTGNSWVPVLVADDGTVIQGSYEIESWAQTNPAGSVGAPASGGAGSSEGTTPPRG